jgi:hypothetical protein
VSRGRCYYIGLVRSVAATVICTNRGECQRLERKLLENHMCSRTSMAPTWPRHCVRAGRVQAKRGRPCRSKTVGKTRDKSYCEYATFSTRTRNILHTEYTHLYIFGRLHLWSMHAWIVSVTSTCTWTRQPAPGSSFLRTVRLRPMPDRSMRASLRDRGLKLTTN